LLAGLSLLALPTNATPGIAYTVKIVVPFAAGGPVDQLAAPDGSTILLASL
jgi:tripartite-type tricarboxylate transporter receptor subunit TctC